MIKRFSVSRASWVVGLAMASLLVLPVGATELVTENANSITQSDGAYQVAQAEPETKTKKSFWKRGKKTTATEKATNEDGITVATEIPRDNSGIYIPKAGRHPADEISEVIIMNTADLHGFTKREMKMAANHTSSTIMASINQGVNMGAQEYGAYKIGSSDILEFVSFNDNTLSRDGLVVRYDGNISLPLIPDIRVAGSTRAQAEDSIREAYAAVYREPEIALTVTTPESKTYTVIGDIQLPGRYAFTRSTSLNQAISLAGGLRERNAGGSSGGGFIGMTGQITKAFVIRVVNGQRQVFDYDMRGIGTPGDHAGEVPIQYGDVIYVPEGKNLVYLLGEGTSRAVELIEGMTLLRMLSFAGGYNASTARLREVVLLREVDNENTEVQLINVRKLLNKGGQDIRLLPGDIIYIPQKHLVRSSEFVQRFTGTISPLFDMYNTAIESFYTLDINSESLQSLQNQNNNVIVPIRGSAGGTLSPRTLGR
jgi:protein involved in polysaccharide export with SLBB domain